PERSSVEEGIIAFRWHDGEFPEVSQPSGEGDDPALHFTIPSAGVDIHQVIDASVASDGEELPFTPIEGTGYSYRLRFITERMPTPTGGDVMVAVVELREGDRHWLRWVADD